MAADVFFPNSPHERAGSRVISAFDVSVRADFHSLLLVISSSGP